MTLVDFEHFQFNPQLLALFLDYPDWPQVCAINDELVQLEGASLCMVLWVPSNTIVVLVNVKLVFINEHLLDALGQDQVLLGLVSLDELLLYGDHQVCRIRQQ